VLLECARGSLAGSDAHGRAATQILLVCRSKDSIARRPYETYVASTSHRMATQLRTGQHDDRPQNKLPASAAHAPHWSCGMCAGRKPFITGWFETRKGFPGLPRGEWHSLSQEGNRILHRPLEGSKYRSTCSVRVQAANRRLVYNPLDANACAVGIRFGPFSSGANFPLTS
jgi:hypothetical protein